VNTLSLFQFSDVLHYFVNIADVATAIGLGGFIYEILTHPRTMKKPIVSSGMLLAGILTLIPLGLWIYLGAFTPMPLTSLLGFVGLSVWAGGKLTSKILELLSKRKKNIKKMAGFLKSRFSSNEKLRCVYPFGAANAGTYLVESVIKAGLDGEYVYIDFSEPVNLIKKLKRKAYFGKIGNLNIKKDGYLTTIEFDSDNTHQKILYHYTDIKKIGKYINTLKQDGGYDIIYVDWGLDFIPTVVFESLKENGVTMTDVVLYNNPWYEDRFKKIEMKEEILIEASGGLWEGVFSEKTSTGNNKPTSLGKVLLEAAGELEIKS